MIRDSNRRRDLNRQPPTLSGRLLTNYTKNSKVGDCWFKSRRRFESRITFHLLEPIPDFPPGKSPAGHRLAEPRSEKGGAHKALRAWAIIVSQETQLVLLSG